MNRINFSTILVIAVILLNTLLLVVFRPTSSPRPTGVPNSKAGVNTEQKVNPEAVSNAVKPLLISRDGRPSAALRSAVFDTLRSLNLSETVSARLAADSDFSDHLIRAMTPELTRRLNQRLQHRLDDRLDDRVNARLDEWLRAHGREMLDGAIARVLTERTEDGDSRVQLALRQVMEDAFTIKSNRNRSAIWKLAAGSEASAQAMSPKTARLPGFLANPDPDHSIYVERDASCPPQSRLSLSLEMPDSLPLFQLVASLSKDRKVFLEWNPPAGTVILREPSPTSPPGNPPAFARVPMPQPGQTIRFSLESTGQTVIATVRLPDGSLYSHFLRVDFTGVSSIRYGIILPPAQRLRILEADISAPIHNFSSR